MTVMKSLIIVFIVQRKKDPAKFDKQKACQTSKSRVSGCFQALKHTFFTFYVIQQSQSLH